MCETKQQKFLWQVVVLLFAAGISNASLWAKPSEAKKRSVKKAATNFYRKYIPIFGANNDITLKPFLSPRLYSLLLYEERRGEKWQAKNPTMKPPVTGDSFTCNAEEEPQRFYVSWVKRQQHKFVTQIRFEYLEGEKIISQCAVKVVFVYRRAKWLIDNVQRDDDIDLQRLLSRKYYTKIPAYRGN